MDGLVMACSSFRANNPDYATSNQTTD